MNTLTPSSPFGFFKRCAITLSLSIAALTMTTGAYSNSYTKLGATASNENVTIDDFEGNLFGINVFFEAPITYRFHVGVSTGYSSGDIDRGSAIDDELSLSIINVTGFLKYYFGLNGSLSPYLVGAVAMHNVGSEQRVYTPGKIGSQEKRTDSDSTLGLEGGAGLLFHLNRQVSLLGELRFRSGNEIDLIENDQSFDVFAATIGLSAAI